MARHDGLVVALEEALEREQDLGLVPPTVRFKGNPPLDRTTP